jgi:hypothetical protein
MPDFFYGRGWQYGNITFEDEVEVNVEEIRGFLDDSREEKPVC